MTPINNYISEKLNLNKNIQDQNIKVLNGIDISKWEWDKTESSYINKYKDIVKEFAQTLYPDEPSFKKIELLCKETYKDYLTISTKLSGSRLEEYIKDELKHLNTFNWSYFEYNYLHQGWWSFMNWVIKQKKT